MLSELTQKIRRSLPRREKALGFRREHFGGIVQLTTPRALVFIDHEYADDLMGTKTVRPDAAAEIHDRPLSAPLEAHLQLTNRCDAGCQGCYTGASAKPAPGELSLSEWKRAIDGLAKMGVFHLALGGGESALLSWLPEIAKYARSRGLVPNLTTSGLAGLQNLLPAAHLFGQINVSIDGLGEGYKEVRGFDGFAKADEAVRQLRKRTRHVGINVVVTNKNFASLGELFRYAKKRRLSEIELLRFKPSGRGTSAYAALACTQAQHRDFFPTIRRLTRRYRVRTKIDCSYTPMIAHHGPPPEHLRQLAVYGCTAGDFLIGVKPNGSVSACSFAAPAKERPKVFELAEYWEKPKAFAPFRGWKELPEPCSGCEYVQLCRGGCHVVSRHVSGDTAAPDPECPRVVEYKKGTTQKRFLPVV